jgi:ketosteroid isomerase-like protein
VADIDDIEAIVYGYAERLDAGDMGGVVDLFEHATWRSDATGDVRRGADAIRQVYDRIAVYEDGTPRTKHLMTNLVVDIDGDSATARSSYSVLQGIVAGEPLRFVVAGRYIDRFERGPDGWRLADRLFLVDLSGDQTRHFS